MNGKLIPYALLGDAAYQPRPSMFTPYLGSKDGFTRKQKHWNFIQSSSRKCVERVFGILNQDLIKNVIMHNSQIMRTQICCYMCMYMSELTIHHF